MSSSMNVFECHEDVTKAITLNATLTLTEANHILGMEGKTEKNKT